MADSTIAGPDDDVVGLLLPAGVVHTRPRIRGGIRRQHRRVALGMLLSDVLALEVALIVSRFILHGDEGVSPILTLMLAVAPAVLFLIFTPHGLYRVPNLTPADEFRRLISAVSATVVVLAIVTDLLSGRMLRGSPPC